MSTRPQRSRIALIELSTSSSLRTSQPIETASDAPPALASSLARSSRELERARNAVRAPRARKGERSREPYSRGCSRHNSDVLTRYAHLLFSQMTAKEIENSTPRIFRILGTIQLLSCIVEKSVRSIPVDNNFTLLVVLLDRRFEPVHFLDCDPFVLFGAYKEQRTAQAGNERSIFRNIAVKGSSSIERRFARQPQCKASPMQNPVTPTRSIPGCDLR